MRSNIKHRRQPINEELKKGDIEDMIDSYLKNKKFEKRVKEIVDGKLEDMFKNMWQRKYWWK